MPLVEKYEQAAQKTGVESELWLKKQYQIEVSNRFTALENLIESEDINRVLENTEEKMNISAKGNLGLYEQKQHEPRYDEERSKHLGQRRQARTHCCRIQTK
jgi:hypothetical protein